jgi:Calcineurin-like phosphoesterase
MSDIHLDSNIFLYDEFPLYPAPDADVLVLCGDIGNIHEKSYSNLLKQASNKFKYVILVAGNHECYGHIIEDADIRVQRLVSLFSNVYFLNKRSVVLDGVRFVGCTLWSYVSDHVSKYLNDYVRTFRSPGCNVTPDDIRRVHKQHVEWIDKELTDDTITPTVVVTHHAPDMRMNGKYLGGHLNTGFATDLPHLFRNPLKAWICGHTHQCLTYTINDVPCTSNCYGYDGENTGFDPLKCVTI